VIDLKLVKQLISMNYSKGVTITPAYIVIHETANTSIGANAQRHFLYWNSNSGANSSVHFVCDQDEVIQLCELNWRCWHVGDGDGSSGITNDNSIGIEICVNADGDYMKARQNAIDLVKWLLPQVKLTADKVVRHRDATGKYCPIKMLDNPDLWRDFIKQIGGTIPMLKRGDIGKEVSDLQSALNKINLNSYLVVDGDFGPATEAAVKAFQATHGLVSDGVVGADTMAKINALLAETEVQTYESKYNNLVQDLKTLLNKYQ
jgi:N-acetyl-anhydromuramyl-L-alanine amidase AmpD